MYNNSMNETTKIEKLKEARELGLTLVGSAFAERGMIQLQTEFHIQKTMNTRTWIGSMKCGERIGKDWLCCCNALSFANWNRQRNNKLK